MTTQTTTPLAVSIAQAAQATGLSEDTIRDAVQKLQLPAKRFGRRILIRWADLAAWVDELEDVA